MLTKLPLTILLVGSLLLSACASSTPNNDMAGMDQNMMAIDPNQPFDAQFIDSMIPHHQSAVAMAGETLTNAEHPELKQLAENIITTQSQEISTGWQPAYTSERYRRKHSPGWDYASGEASTREQVCYTTTRRPWVHC